jgi:hypothetical protein
MFTFGKVLCVLCDRLVSKSSLLRIDGRRDICVCGDCRDLWQRGGSLCGRCHLPVDPASEVGVFLDRYILGHVACGGTSIIEPGFARRAL